MFALLFVMLTACSNELARIPGTTARIGRPVAEDRDVEMRIFVDPATCGNVVGVRSGSDSRSEAARKADELRRCLPYMDRSGGQGRGEVRLAMQFINEGSVVALPNFQEQLELFHIPHGTEGGAGQDITVIPHKPTDSRRLFILLIDGSSSMSSNRRMEKVRKALLREDVGDAFFQDGAKSGALLLQFTSGKPKPVGGVMQVLESKEEYQEAVRKLRVLSGYTHLYDAIEHSITDLLEDPYVLGQIERWDYTVTVVALTDGFNNLAAGDRCRDNARRLSKLLGRIDEVRLDPGANLKTMPAIFTVGLGKARFQRLRVPRRPGADVRPVELCGRNRVNRRISGDLELEGIDDISLRWIADRGQGKAMITRTQDKLAEGFKAAAQRRYEWFEVRYRVDPKEMRRRFKVKMRLPSQTVAEAQVEIWPHAWLDGPPGETWNDGWRDVSPFRHTFTVLMPILGLLIGLSQLGAALFNTRRALFGRVRRRKPGKKQTD